MNYLNAIKTFVHLAEVGSFTKTAKDLAIKTSTVSRHIAELEKDLGIALINRTTRGMALTEGGSVFYQKVLPVLDLMENAKEAAASLNKLPSGDLKMSVSSGFCSTFITPYIDSFTESYPDIRLIINITSSPPDLIGAGYDLSIQSGHLVDSTSMARQLLPHWYIACCTPRTLENIQRKWCLTDIHLQAMITSLSELNSRWYAHTQDKIQECHLQSKLSLSDDIALLDVIVNNSEVGLIPYWLANPLISRGEICDVMAGVRFSPTPQLPAVWAVYSYKKTVSSKVRTFIDFVLRNINNIRKQ